MDKNNGRILETLYINSVSGMKESILNAAEQPLENFSETVDFQPKVA